MGRAPLDCVQTTNSFVLCFQRARHADVHPVAALSTEHFSHSENARCRTLKSFSQRTLCIKQVVSCLVATAAAMTQLLHCQIDKRCLWIQELKLFLAPCHDFVGEHSVTVHCLKGKPLQSKMGIPSISLVYFYSLMMLHKTDCWWIFSFALI